MAGSSIHAVIATAHKVISHSAARQGNTSYHCQKKKQMQYFLERGKVNSKVLL
jgi:hypothetical protein